MYNDANSIKAETSHSSIVDSYDFVEITTITDIDGGYGGLMFKILQAKLSVKGVIADLPLVIQKTSNIVNYSRNII